MTGGGGKTLLARARRKRADRLEADGGAARTRPLAPGELGFGPRQGHRPVMGDGRGNITSATLARLATGIAGTTAVDLEAVLAPDSERVHAAEMDPAVVTAVGTFARGIATVYLRALTDEGVQRELVDRMGVGYLVGRRLLDTWTEPFLYSDDEPSVLADAATLCVGGEQWVSDPERVVEVTGEALIYLRARASAVVAGDRLDEPTALRCLFAGLFLALAEEDRFGDTRSAGQEDEPVAG